MLKKSLLAAAALMLAMSPALAGHCPQDAAAIDKALGVVTVSDEVKTQVTALKDKGMAEHSAGDHAASEASLAEAMRLLLNSIQ
jgi:hypothetical protein